MAYEARHTRGRGEAAVQRSDWLPLLLPKAVEPPPWRQRVGGWLLLQLTNSTDRFPLLRAVGVATASGRGRVRVGLDALLVRLA